MCGLLQVLHGSDPVSVAVLAVARATCTAGAAAATRSRADDCGIAMMLAYDAVAPLALVRRYATGYATE